MATTGRSTDAVHDPERAATLLGDADFVHLLGRRDGDALAAVGLLGRALEGRDIPYQVSLAPHSAAAERRMMDQSLSVGAGLDAGDLRLAHEAVSLEAYDIAAALDADPDPVLAIAGTVAGGTVPNGAAYDAAQEKGVTRRPGVGIPTADPAVGLAYSGLLHADFSGDEDAAQSFLDALDVAHDADAMEESEGTDEPLNTEEAYTRIASAVALEVSESEHEGRTSRGLERLLAPLSSPGPFETVEGYADVLDALAHHDPGTGVAFILGDADRETALSSWKQAGARLHRAVVSLSLDQSDGVAVATVEDIDPTPVARLVRDFRVPERAVIVGNGESVALATTDRDAGSWLAETFEDGLVADGDTLATVETEEEPTTVATRLREEG